MLHKESSHFRCGLQSRSVLRLNRHVLVVHLGRRRLNASGGGGGGGGGGESGRASGETNGYTCNLCGAHFPGLTDVRDHLSIMHQARHCFTDPTTTVRDLFRALS